MGQVRTLAQKDISAETLACHFCFGTGKKKREEDPTQLYYPFIHLSIYLSFHPSRTSGKLQISEVVNVIFLLHTDLFFVSFALNSFECLYILVVEGFLKRFFEKGVFYFDRLVKHL